MEFMKEKQSLLSDRNNSPLEYQSKGLGFKTGHTYKKCKRRVTTDSYGRPSVHYVQQRRRSRLQRDDSCSTSGKDGWKVFVVVERIINQLALVN